MLNYRTERNKYCMVRTTKTNNVDSVPIFDRKEKTFRHAILTREIGKALAGDIDAIRDLMDREDGKPRQAVDLGGQQDNPLVTSDVFKFQIIDPINDINTPETSAISPEQNQLNDAKATG